jgi:murein L,D-transpeptidase YafK
LALDSLALKDFFTMAAVSRRLLMEDESFMDLIPAKRREVLHVFSSMAWSRAADRWNMTMNGLSLSGTARASRKALVAGAAIGLAATLSGCNQAHDNSRAMQALSPQILAEMNEKGVAPTAPILIRAFKKESELEVWKMRPDGTYVLLKTFPICRWSGQLGPKTKEGDRQSPEGFYSITPAMMNPNSSYYLSFNVGYPNAYDRAHGATGGAVMVHGICSSAGCFAMTDAQIADIYALSRDAFAGGQRSIQLQAYPFHMNAQNLAKYRLDPNMAFWKELKKGADHFEASKRDVSVNVCNKHYVFGAQADPGQPIDASAPCPPLKYDSEVETKVAAIERSDSAAMAEIVSKGERPVRLVYRDGAQHPAFANRVAEVSRPDALVPPLEIALDEPKNRVTAPTRTASAPANALLLAEAQASSRSKATPDLGTSAQQQSSLRAPVAKISTLLGTN